MLPMTRRHFAADFRRYMRYVDDDTPATPERARVDADCCLCLMRAIRTANTPRRDMTCCAFSHATPMRYKMHAMRDDAIAARRLLSAICLRALLLLTF